MIRFILAIAIVSLIAVPASAQIGNNGNWNPPDLSRRPPPTEYNPPNPLPPAINNSNMSGGPNEVCRQGYHFENGVCIENGY